MAPSEAWVLWVQNCQRAYLDPLVMFTLHPPVDCWRRDKLMCAAGARIHIELSDSFPRLGLLPHAPASIVGFPVLL